MLQPDKKNKIDRRIQRTRLALRTALLDLLKKKSYDDISLEEITEHANVGRATFYLHYKDKEDLILEQFSTDRIQKEENRRCPLLLPTNPFGSNTCTRTDKPGDFKRRT